MKRSLIILFTGLQLLVTLCFCGQKPALDGRYEAVNPQHSGNDVVLVLKSDGNGSWNFEDEEVPLRWDQRDQQIWLHYRGGGVVAGKITGVEEIEMTLPGIGNLSFKKKQ